MATKSGGAGKRAKMSPGVLAWMAVGVFLLYVSAGPGVIVLAALVVYLMARAMREQKKSERSSERFVRPAVEALFENASYEPGRGFSRETIYKLGLLHRTTRFISRHRITGTCRGIPFEAAAVRLAYRSYSIGKEPFTPLFDGLFLKFAWPREDSGIVRVIPSGYRNAASSEPENRSKKSAKKTNLPQTHPVLVTHPGFDEAFRVYAQNPDGASSLFSAPFCERAVGFARRAGVPVLLCFYEDALFVGLDFGRPFPFDTPPEAGETGRGQGERIKALELIGDCIDSLAPTLSRAGE